MTEDKMNAKQMNKKRPIHGKYWWTEYNDNEIPKEKEYITTLIITNNERKYKNNHN